MTDAEVPVRLCCGERHLDAQCPDGLVMCCICFSRFPVEGLREVEGGHEDACLGCAEAERDTTGGDQVTEPDRTAPASVPGCPECGITGGLHVTGCRAALAVQDACDIEAAITVLERRYGGIRPESLENVLYELRCVARGLRRRAGLL